MSKFKIGNKVRRLTHHTSPEIPVGHIDTVATVSKDGTWISLESIYAVFPFHESNFELVTEEPKNGTAIQSWR